MYGMSDATRILSALQQGNTQAADELLPLVYDELRTLAAQKLASELPGQTLQPTALVHEAWLRLTGTTEKQFDGQGHFIAAAAEAMRRILIERARQKCALKRGSRPERLDLDQLEFAIGAEDESLLRVDEAIQKLALEDPETAKFIKLRFFTGLSSQQAAALLGVPERTARRHWSFARAWLYRELRRQDG
jgi:RNA polymerase sigma factor (TIGR02999 family)